MRSILPLSLSLWHFQPCNEVYPYHSHVQQIKMIKIVIAGLLPTTEIKNASYFVGFVVQCLV